MPSVIAYITGLQNENFHQHPHTNRHIRICEILAMVQ